MKIDWSSDWFNNLLLFQLQLNLMPYEYIPPVDIKSEPYIPETGEHSYMQWWCHSERLGLYYWAVLSTHSPYSILWISVCLLINISMNVCIFVLESTNHSLGLWYNSHVCLIPRTQAAETTNHTKREKQPVHSPHSSWSPTVCSLYCNSESLVTCASQTCLNANVEIHI